MNKVLVTGARGFVGSKVISDLESAGYEVHATTKSQLSHVSGRSVFWHSIDLLDKNSVESLMKAIRPSGLIHLAWESAHGTYWHDPKNLDWVIGSLNLVRSFEQEGGTRAVLIGSSAEYDWNTACAYDEYLTPIAPSSLYGACKSSLHEMVSAWAKTTDISFSWARLFNVFGPNEDPKRLIPRAIQSFLVKENFLIDSGSSLRDFLYIDDAANALVSLFKSSTTGPVNIASGISISIRELLLIISNELNAEKYLFFNSRKDISPFKSDAVIADITRLRDEINWTSRISFRERIIDTCNWWRAKHDDFNFK